MKLMLYELTNSELEQLLAWVENQKAPPPKCLQDLNQVEIYALMSLWSQLKEERESESLH
jgi:hypothetical protein